MKTDVVVAIALAALGAGSALAGNEQSGAPIAVLRIGRAPDPRNRWVIGSRSPSACAFNVADRSHKSHSQAVDRARLRSN